MTATLKIKEQNKDAVHQTVFAVVLSLYHYVNFYSMRGYISLIAKGDITDLLLCHSPVTKFMGCKNIKSRSS